MMLGFVGYLAGFNQTLDRIEVGNEYDGSQYIAMRVVSSD